MVYIFLLTFCFFHIRYTAASFQIYISTALCSSNKVHTTIWIILDISISRISKSLFLLYQLLLFVLLILFFFFFLNYYSSISCLIISDEFKLLKKLISFSNIKFINYLLKYISVNFFFIFFFLALNSLFSPF
jgi:hypothetical protein